MDALAQNSSKIPQGAVSDKVSNLHLKKQHHMRMYTHEMLNLLRYIENECI